MGEAGIGDGLRWSCEGEKDKEGSSNVPAHCVTARPPAADAGLSGQQNNGIFDSNF